MDWMEHYEQNPWGEWRNDLRQEVFRQRLLSGLFGDEENGKDTPGSSWPYKSINDSTDWEALIEERLWIAENLVEDGSGTGRMKWKDGVEWPGKSQ